MSDIDENTTEAPASQPIFTVPRSLRAKLRRVYDYLFADFSFDMAKMDYEEYWGRISAEDRPISSFKLRTIAALVEKGSSVLDVGCGDGNLLRYLQQERGTSGCGIDVSQKAVDLTRKRGIKAEVADISSEAFALSGRTDYIVASEVLEHLPNPERLMLSLKGAFTKSLIVTIPNSGFIGERLRLAFGRTPKQWVLNPSEHLHFWTVADFTHWCGQLGYDVLAYKGLYDEFYDVKVKLWKYLPRLFSRYLLYVLVTREVALRDPSGE